MWINRGVYNALNEQIRLLREAISDSRESLPDIVYDKEGNACVKVTAQYGLVVDYERLDTRT